MPDEKLVDNVALEDESVELTTDETITENPFTEDETPSDTEEPAEDNLDLGAPSEDEPQQEDEPQEGEKPKRPDTEKIVAKRLKEIADEKNRYKIEAEQERLKNAEIIKKATEALKALGIQGEFEDAVDEVIASNQGITKEELRAAREKERKIADAERVLREAEAKQLELTHLAEIKKAFPHVKANSIFELGEDFLDLMSVMYQKEKAGQGKMDPVRAYRLTHIEEVQKYQANDTAKKAQLKTSRSTGGGHSSSSSLPADELANLERWNASCDDPKQRMTVAEYKRRKGIT